MRKEETHKQDDSIWDSVRELGALPPEIDDEGNVEYKLKLVDPSLDRLEHLITQLKWRLSEGNGEAKYELGVDDDGTFIGLSPEDMAASMATLRRMANALNADVSIIREIQLDQLGNTFHKAKPGHKVLEALVRRRPSEDQECFTDIRLVIVGGHGEGKSTLLGSITHGIKDNGRGRARLNLLRHRHEIESGRTSSISHEIIGYDSQGVMINYATTHVSTWEDICELSSKIVTFLDTCGYSKYLRTTVSGMSGYAPDYACLVLSGNSGRVSDMAREHFSLALMLDVPLFVVVTKIDVASDDQLRRTLGKLFTLLKAPGIDKIPLIVQSDNDYISCASRLAHRGPEVPIFLVSSVSGTNIDRLVKFFNYLTRPFKHYDDLLEEPVEFQVEEVYFLPDVGSIVGGVLRRGRINVENEESKRTYHLGPDSRGCFIPVTVTSIHRHRVQARYIHCGQAATLAIKGNKLDHRQLHRGMVLLGTENPACYYEFEADVSVLYHPSGLTVGSCGTIHSGSVRQRARVISILSTTTDKDVCVSSRESETEGDDQSNNKHLITSGNQGRCIFRFMDKPEYLRTDAQILFMEGKTKCLGRVLSLLKQE